MQNDFRAGIEQEGKASDRLYKDRKAITVSLVTNGLSCRVLKPHTVAILLSRSDKVLQIKCIHCTQFENLFGNLTCHNC